MAGLRAGLMSGLGTGLVKRADNEREDLAAQRDAAIQEARDIRLGKQRTAEFDQANAAERARDQTRIAADDARSDRSDKARRGLISSTITDENGKVFGITEGGDTKDLGIKAPPQKSRRGLGGEDDSGMSPNDERLWNNVVAQYKTTTGTGSQKKETTDWPAVAAHFQRIKRPDLAAQVRQDGGSDVIDTNSPEYLDAQAAAKTWADEKAGYFSSDKTDFADTGGSRSEAIRQKAEEIYRSRTGKGGAARGAKDEARPAAAANASPKAGKPKGGGTEQDPFKPTTQDEFDALDSGDVFVNPADGKVYKKN